MVFVFAKFLLTLHGLSKTVLKNRKMFHKILIKKIKKTFIQYDGNGCRKLTLRGWYVASEVKKKERCLLKGGSGEEGVGWREEGGRVGKVGGRGGERRGRSIYLIMKTKRTGILKFIRDYLLSKFFVFSQSRN